MTNSVILTSYMGNPVIYLSKGSVFKGDERSKCNVMALTTSNTVIIMYDNVFSLILPDILVIWLQNH